MLLPIIVGGVNISWVPFMEQFCAESPGLPGTPSAPGLPCLPLVPGKPTEANTTDDIVAVMS